MCHSFWLSADNFVHLIISKFYLYHRYASCTLAGNKKSVGCLAEIDAP